MTNLKKRDSLNILNVFLCLLVIFIHTASSALGALDKTKGAYALMVMLWRAATVAVPGFLFVSGVKIGLSNKKQGYLPYMGNKLAKIYLPYVLAVILYYVYYLLLQYFPFSGWNLVKHIGIGDLTAHFYFVVIIMQFYLLAPLFRKLLEKYNTWLLLFGSLVITLICWQYLPAMITAVTGKQILYNDRLFTTYLVFYVLGMAAGMHYQTFLSILTKNKGVFWFLGVFTAVLNVGFFWYGNTIGVGFGFLEMLQILYCLCIIPCMYLVALRLEKHKNVFQSQWFKIINSSTFGVYLLHLLVMFGMDYVLNQMGITRAGLAFVLRFLGTLAITFALCGTYTVCKQKLKKSV